MSPVPGRLYDAVLALPERLGLTRLRQDLLGDLTGRVLEVGAGTGRNTPALRNARLMVQIDPDLALLRRARVRLPAPGTRRLLVAARAEALPFPPGAFDATIATLVLCSVDDPVAGLREMRRVTRPGGQLRLLEHVLARGRTIARVQRAMTPGWARVAGGCHLDREHRAALPRAGWTDVREERRLGTCLARIEATAA